MFPRVYVSNISLIFLAFTSRLFISNNSNVFLSCLCWSSAKKQPNKLYFLWHLMILVFLSYFLLGTKHKFFCFNNILPSLIITKRYQGNCLIKVLTCCYLLHTVLFGSFLFDPITSICSILTVFLVLLSSLVSLLMKINQTGWNL